MDGLNWSQTNAATQNSNQSEVKFQIQSQNFSSKSNYAIDKICNNLDEDTIKDKVNEVIKVSLIFIS